MAIFNQSWEEYIEDLKHLARKIKESDKKFDIIIGIPRGGFIPAVYISHQLEIPLIVDLCPPVTTIQILVVDDISDSGSTLKKYERDNITIATLHIKTGTEVIPDFYVREFPSTTWIKYPYESKIF